MAIHECLFIRAKPAFRASFHVGPEVCHVELLELGGEVLFVQVLLVVLQEHMDVHDVPDAAAADLKVAVEVGQQEEVVVVPGEVVEVVRVRHCSPPGVDVVVGEPRNGRATGY